MSNNRVVNVLETKCTQSDQLTGREGRVRPYFDAKIAKFARIILKYVSFNVHNGINQLLHCIGFYSRVFVLF